ncbi:18164_t:CDS:10 [Entrophospora sp. SA101]|nr:18164_t:CDS:10 [Entrophospora sp. SA101]
MTSNYRNFPVPNSISVNTTNLSQSTPNVINTEDGKIICVADIRGDISRLNNLAEETNASYIIHSGDFGFYESESLGRMSDRTLRHNIQYTILIPEREKSRLLSLNSTELRKVILESDLPLLSEFSLFKEGKKTLKVPVYTIWGACEDVAVLEKFRTGEYKVHNLNILDEAMTYLIDIGGVSLRLFGLGGTGTIAGGQGTMWTTILQIGKLVDTAQRVFDSSETRVLVTHASPGREGLLAQLSIMLRADFTVSAGLHFRYGISYNEFSVQADQESFRRKLETSRINFYETWKTVKNQVENRIDESQKQLLQNALSVVDRVPLPSKEEYSFKNMWNFNLPDAQFGWVSLGFNFAYRRNNTSAILNVNNIPGNSQTSAIVEPNSPITTTADRHVKRPQPSPIIHPQIITNGITNNNTITQSPFLTTQRSSSPVPIALNDDNNNKPSWNSNNGDSDNGSSSSTNETLISTNGNTRSPYSIYVGNIPRSITTDDEVKEHFTAVGCQVEKVRLMNDKVTQKPRDFGFIDFIDSDSIDKAHLSRTS